MILTLTKNEYIELVSNTVDLYTSSMKNMIANELIIKDKITLKASKVNEGYKYPVLVEDRLKAIELTTKDEDFLSFYENWEFEKSYKYSVPLVWKLDGNKNFDNIVAALVSKGKLLEFNENEMFNIPDDIACNIKNSIPYYKKDGDYALFKFVIKIATTNGFFETVIIKYPIVISINMRKNFLEIRFDGGRFDENSQKDYITPKITYCITWLKELLEFDLYNVNAENAIDIIKNDQSKKAVVQKQMMELSSGGAAELTASADKDYTLPFIGDLRQLINQNADLFNKSLEIKKLIEEFLDNQEETAYYPYIHVRWLNQIKARQINVKIVFKYYDTKYIQMHNMQSSSRVTKERMEYAIEYLFKSGSFTKGEEIQ